MNVIDVFRERGFLEQMTHDQELYDLFQNERVTCYIGFDPTAASLHVGSLVPIMSLAHMQREGHRPIALVGGGTGLVGDPSGKTEMRKMMTLELTEQNAAAIKKQLSHFLDFDADRALLLNNAEWLTPLEYIPFLRDYGRHFSVNRMIKAESYRARLDSEEGLSFIEFNYMVLQAYDFLVLNDRQGCKLQMGGSDQWGNIVAGIDLIRRKSQKPAFGITFPLITTSSGAKMGKTAQGAVWLDPEKTSPYEYYQFWINTDDQDVERFLALFTFLPIEEVREVSRLNGAELNAAKSVLAFEATRLAHGSEAAVKALQAAAGVFGARKVPSAILPSSKLHGMAESAQEVEAAMPQTAIDQSELQAGIAAFKLFTQIGLAKSGGAARRLIDQGGAYVNGERIAGVERPVSTADLQDGAILLRAGKKQYHKILVKG